MFGLRPGRTQEGGSVRKRKNDCKFGSGKTYVSDKYKKEIMKERLTEYIHAFGFCYGCFLRKGIGFGDLSFIVKNIVGSPQFNGYCSDTMPGVY